MSTAPLAEILRHRAQVLIDGAIELPGPQATAARDTGELLCVLARVLEGKPVLRAFGAPGDWGYNTAIGAALAKILRADAGTPANTIGTRPPSARVMVMLSRALGHIPGDTISVLEGETVEDGLIELAAKRCEMPAAARALLDRARRGQMVGTTNLQFWKGYEKALQDLLGGAGDMLARKDRILARTTAAPGDLKAMNRAGEVQP